MCGIHKWLQPVLLGWNLGEKNVRLLDLYLNIFTGQETFVHGQTQNEK